MTDTPSPYFAAVDLGSNSFHMVIARINQGTVEIIDRVKDMVQIARGMHNGELAEDAQQRAIECLERFAERLRNIPSAQVRAVGTKSLRAASNARSFLKQAEKALGCPIAIISGFEEARLVYQGLSHSVTNDDNRRLVIDIGGASTEFIIGKDDDPELLESLSLGCVSFSGQFTTSKVTTGTMREAYLAACTELETIRPVYLHAGWDITYGTSGTMRAIADLTAPADGGAVIKASSLANLYEEVVNNTNEVLAPLPKLRRDVLPAGIAILHAICSQLNIEKIHVADASLKEGLLYDTIGRLNNEDARIAAVSKLQRQYHADVQQAHRVAETAVNIWRQINAPELPGVSRTKILRWAAQLHEIGLGISHSGHHHHSFYILSHTDMAGFGRYEQQILAYLVRAHRKKLNTARFEGLDDPERGALLPIVLCLRVAVILNRRRADSGCYPLVKQPDDTTFEFVFNEGWLASNPLTTSSLDKEIQYFKNLGLNLSFT